RSQMRAWEACYRSWDEDVMQAGRLQGPASAHLSTGGRDLQVLDEAPVAFPPHLPCRQGQQAHPQAVDIANPETDGAAANWCARPPGREPADSARYPPRP